MVSEREQQVYVVSIEVKPLQGSAMWGRAGWLSRKRRQIRVPGRFVRFYTLRSAVAVIMNLVSAFSPTGRNPTRAPSSS